MKKKMPYVLAGILLMISLVCMACGSTQEATALPDDANESIQDEEDEDLQNDPNDGLGGDLNEDTVNDFSGFEGIWLGEANNDYDYMEFDSEGNWTLYLSGEQVAGGKERISLEKSRKALARYGLDKEVDHMYPFELSGGMARRVLIGTAVVEQPQLVIADEPTPGLHMEAALRVLSHFREIADQGAGVLLITHDLELALKTADKIVVFYAGTAVEEADTVDFNREAALRHPYTRALFRAMPEHGFAPEPGIQPYVRDLPEGCPYGPRCPKYKTECSKEVSYVPYQGGLVRCICPGDENEILPGILSGPAGLKGQMTSEQITSEQMASGQRSGEYNAWGKEGVSL